MGFRLATAAISGAFSTAAIPALRRAPSGGSGDRPGARPAHRHGPMPLRRRRGGSSASNIQVGFESHRRVLEVWKGQTPSPSRPFSGRPEVWTTLWAGDDRLGPPWIDYDLLLPVLAATTGFTPWTKCSPARRLTRNPASRGSERIGWRTASRSVAATGDRRRRRRTVGWRCRWPSFGSTERGGAPAGSSDRRRRLAARAHTASGAARSCGSDARARGGLLRGLYPWSGPGDRWCERAPDRDGEMGTRAA